MKILPYAPEEKAHLKDLLAKEGLDAVLALTLDREALRKAVGLFSLVRNKVVYNACYGGYTLSKAAVQMYCELTGIRYSRETEDDIYAMYELQREIERDDPALVQVVETLGDAANGMCAKLRIEKVEPGTWVIHDHDGKESVDWK